MISALDVLCIVIAVVLIALESQRGILLAIVDLAGASVAVVVAGMLYRSLYGYAGSYSLGYLVVFAGIGVLAVGLAVYLSFRTKEYVRGWESAVGAFIGLASGVVVSYGIYTYTVMRYGAGSALLKNSLLAYQFDEHGVVYEMTQFVRTLMGR